MERKSAPAPVKRTPQEQLLFDIRQELKKRSEHQLVALLNGSCTIPDVEGDEILLNFLPAYTDFHLGKVRESLEAVVQAASAVLGREVTIRCDAGEDAGPKGSALLEEAEKLGAKRVSPPAG